MEIKSYDHIYKCRPVGWYNEDNSITVGLKCPPKPEFDSYARSETTYAMEERAKKGREFIGKFVKSITGLTVDGKEVTSFEQLYETGPADLYDWIYTAVLSQKILNDAEIKN
jgi:hypothetical protein